MTTFDAQSLSFIKEIGYTFNDDTLLLTALTHKSLPEREQNTHGINNERLEFLGDAVLSLVTAHFLYRQYPSIQEGELSRIRAQFVCQENLSQGAKKIGLGQFIKSDKAMRASGSNNSKSILADALEAIIGAIYIDGGLEKAGAAIFKILGEPSKDLPKTSQDAKTRLQEIVQANTHNAPRYVVLESSGPPHAPTFLIGVEIDGSIFAQGSGENKKTAAQNAAVKALERMAATPE
jgi:ribonuclease-3